MSLDTSEILKSNANSLRNLIVGMRSAFARGENVMEYARTCLGQDSNTSVATLIAYDLQAGSYVRNALENPGGRDLWCSQLAEILNPLVVEGSSLLEVGCGEATTLAGILQKLTHTPNALGFDISWSRCNYGLQWLSQKNVSANLFVADLFDIPLADQSVDVVYTSHSLEPNGGREEDAIAELLRVARRAVVLIEPAYELSDEIARERMRAHGYVRNLRQVAEKLEGEVSEYRLLDYSINPKNPSGLLLLKKKNAHSTELAPVSNIQWKCPLTSSPMTQGTSGFYSAETGIVYPVLSGIPLLRAEHAVVASAFEQNHSL
ncbi:hypothetical protein DBR37_07100 [Herminiimonas sp. KBW02]|uniref:class I SAM-dependent methyltransferase n=1 Tax=Herminiimonas sp. KBW02 TaxID=2153363 RepID=UPI000F5B4E2B|nr:class I SAM-dependent methyltransferase [Herminiimonas sp. KBW02]RQO36090.1 hypothetical protein DBR37_07100 [Herminiimonas sp. KBW02]